MPHATDDKKVPEDWEAIAANDEDVIAGLLQGELQPDSGLDALNRDLIVGEKADDAIDYEDISDDDLPDEEDTGDAPRENGHAPGSGDVEGDEQDFKFDDDDLFGDGELPDGHGDGTNQEQGEVALNTEDFDDLFDEDEKEAIEANESTEGPAAPIKSLIRSDDIAEDEDTVMQDAKDQATIMVEEDAPAEHDPALLEQLRLFGQHRQRQETREAGLRMGADFQEIPSAPQTDQELFERIWPKYDKEEIPRFGVLLPWKRAFYNGKRPLKVPKPIQPHKANLDLELDQERFFKLNIPHPQKRRRGNVNEHGVIVITQEDKRREVEDDNIVPELLDDEEVVGGVSVHDLRMLCEDWDDLSVTTEPTGDDIMVTTVDENTPIDASDNPHGYKRRRLSHDVFGALPIFCDDFASFDDPETVTAQIAKKVLLDLNDPSLLIDTSVQPALKSKSLTESIELRGDASGDIKKALERKFNFSNDDAYELLKENHSHKIRSTLGNLAIEHSLVAMKLQYPFYKVKLGIKEARSFHRPTHAFPIGTIRFQPNVKHKRSNMRGREAADIFSDSTQLSMADNSQMLMVEYSEEYPIALSNFGMGSKLVNYYRRQDENDHNRPKLELGDAQVLLPQDRSPFAIFGNVEPGKTVPTFHNAMYRAPVFRHVPKQTDFLCIRSTTGVEGTKWHLRNMENLHVSGQQFPLQEVPGTHSRRVTDAAKRRLRMISWRIWKRNRDRHTRGAWLSNEMIREHLPGSDIAQNRGKMREFMAYDKVNSSWKPKDGDVVPEETTMRAWIKPEEICLLDSMQVGDRHLIDVGYNQDSREGDADDDDDKESQGLDQQLAPWQTTKNFINACQGKAMLQLHGEGDPSGRGEAFSFIKTSMKGGFKAVGESIEERLDEKRRKELGGHSYNVAKQQQMYEDAIKRIWDAQASSLSAAVEPEELEPGVEDNEVASRKTGRTPRTEHGTPSLLGRRDDASISQYSHMSNGSQSGKILRIQRKIKGKNGKIETVEEIVHDRKVIQQYMRRKQDLEFSSKDIDDFVPTGNAEHDEVQRKLLLAKLERLEKNKERRKHREKQKALVNSNGPATPGSPGDAGPSRNTGTTQRKCANCGMVGHIKTNKKLCPLLNGTQKQDQSGFTNAAFAGPSSATTPAGTVVPQTPQTPATPATPAGDLF